MPASLADVDAALFTALSALCDVNVSDGAPFALVARYAGEPTKDGLGEVCAQYPAALLRWDTETGTRDVDTAGYGSEDRLACRWTVIVAVEDPRAIDDAIAGASGVPGALACIGAVTGALNALQVPGLWRGRSVRQVSAGPIPALIHRGSAYGYAVVFEALLVAAVAADPADASVPLTKIDGDINQQSSGDAPTNPFESFAADTTD